MAAVATVGIEVCSVTDASVVVRVAAFIIIFLWARSALDISGLAEVASMAVRKEAIALRNRRVTRSCFPLHCKGGLCVHI